MRLCIYIVSTRVNDLGVHAAACSRDVRIVCGDRWGAADRRHHIITRPAYTQMVGHADCIYHMTLLHQEESAQCYA